MDGGMSTEQQPMVMPTTASIPGEDRGIVGWAKWLGLTALAIFAGYGCYFALLTVGYTSSGVDAMLLRMTFFIRISESPLASLAAYIFPCAALALIAAWFYYYPASIRAFLFLVSVLWLTMSIAVFILSGSMPFSSWTTVIGALFLGVASIFIINAEAFWNGAQRVQRAWVSVLYAAVVAQWVAIITAAFIIKDNSYNTVDLILFLFGFGLLLSRAKLGWFTGIASCALLLYISCIKSQGNMSLGSEPYLPLLIYGLLLMPPVIRWYFPTGIWAYLGDLEKVIVRAISRWRPAKGGGSGTGV